MPQKITATRADQLGMQVYSRIYAMAYCQLNNLDYIHTPLPKKYSHFEDFFNLGFDKRSRKQNEQGVLDIGESIIPSFLSRNSGTFRSIKFDKTFLAKLRYKYYMGEKENSKSFSSAKGIKACIHIRKCTEERSKKNPQKKHLITKPGITERDQEKAMWGIREPPPAFMPACFRKLNKIKADRINVNIYSNEELDLDFSDELFQDPKFQICTHYDTKIEHVIHDLISCDILFRYGVSSFSGICSIYNRNLSVFALPPGKRYLSNSYVSDNCCYMQAPIKFEELPTFDDIALDNFLCNQV